MRITKDNARIVHYLKEECAYILEINGKRYISTEMDFYEDTKENRDILYKQIAISRSTLEQLDKAPSVEWCDLVDGESMFSFADINEFDIDLPNLVSSKGMFFGSKLKKFKSTLPNLVDGMSMFCDSNLQIFESDLPKLKDGSYMFFDSELKEFKSELPSLVKGECIFPQLSIKEFELHMQNNEECSQTFL